MHLHISRRRRNGKTYEYAQIVESYRRSSDGKPTQRVVANLGQLEPVAIDNLRAALKASRRGQQVVLDRRKLPEKVQFTKPAQNLRYLDVAVLLELWRDWGLDDVLGELLPDGDADVAPADVVAALAIQRCVEPGSKLYAERWFPRTALPELVAIEPKRFNNTRLHRVLEQLDEATPRLMRELPKLYRSRQGQFVSLFLDVSDTWFVGHGPELAARAKTKEGLFERKVGIVLLCNERGLPLRWQVIGGKHAEHSAMHGLLEDIRAVPWVGQAPVVCDRSMGTTSELRKLLATKLRFITALKTTEFGSYADALPHEPFADLEPSSQPPADKQQDPCVQEAGRRAAEAGMERVTSTMYVLDLGVVERDAPVERETSNSTEDHAGRALRLTRQIAKMVEEGQADSYASAARRLGITRDAARWYRPLGRLDPSLQQEILDGRAAQLSISKLTKLARIGDADEQRRQYEQLLADSSPVSPRTTPSASALAPDDEPEEPLSKVRLRAVVCFNPERFADQRRKAQHDLAEVRAYVDNLNRKLAGPRCKRNRRHIEKELDGMLSRKGMLDVYRFEVDQTKNADGAVHYTARVELDVQRWQRRRRYDGFYVIVGHPELPQSAAEPCRLYRDKDAVEKDFRTIKSLVKLRPVRHRTDTKVRAHVTLCMLALLLERTLEQRLRAGRSKLTAAAALEYLQSCQLNRFDADDGGDKGSYVVTHPDDEQKALLRQLRLEQLADDDAVVERLLPR